MGRAMLKQRSFGDPSEDCDRGSLTCERPVKFFLKGKWRVFRRFIELEGNYSSVQTEKIRNQEQRKIGKKGHESKKRHGTCYTGQHYTLPEAR